jgi:hypothetical protein
MWTQLHACPQWGLRPIIARPRVRKESAHRARPAPAHQPGRRESVNLAAPSDSGSRYVHSSDGIDAIDPASDPADRRAFIVLDLDCLRVPAVAAPHHKMRVLSCRIDGEADSVPISGDDSRPPLAEFGRDEDVPIYDVALAERDVPHSDLRHPRRRAGPSGQPLWSVVSFGHAEGTRRLPPCGPR